MELFNKKVQADTLNHTILAQIGHMKQTIDELRSSDATTQKVLRHKEAKDMEINKLRM